MSKFLAAGFILVVGIFVIFAAKSPPYVKLEGHEALCWRLVDYQEPPEEVS